MLPARDQIMGRVRPKGIPVFLEQWLIAPHHIRVVGAESVFAHEGPNDSSGSSSFALADSSSVVSDNGSQGGPADGTSRLGSIDVRIVRARGESKGACGKKSERESRVHR